MNQIAIIGAGPAGIEAAAVLSALNYHVLLFEKEANTLSHVLNKATLFPDFTDTKKLAEQCNKKLTSEKITFFPSTEIVDMAQVGTRWTLTNQRKQSYSVDAVILATGYTPFDANRKEEYGYGIYQGVISSLDLEKQLQANKVVNSIGETPKKIVFLQCVGSRDEKTGNNYCSKVCCITAVKQAIEVKKLYPEVDIYIFYMDLRMWGQSFEELYRTSQEEYQINYVRGRISESAETFDGKIQIKAEDTLVGIPLRMTTDLLVLMIGMEASDSGKKLAEITGCAGEYGFAQSKEPHLYDNLTCKQGLILAGACKRPMSINDAVNDGRSAALAAHETVSK